MDAVAAPLAPGTAKVAKVHGTSNARVSRNAAVPLLNKIFFSI